MTVDTTEVVNMIRKGDKIGVLVYLHNGGDPNARNHMGWTLLHIACMEGQTAVVEVLLDAGASANSCTTDMVTPLHRACMHGYRSIAELLIKKNAYINAQDKAGNTPLHEAAKGFHTGVVRLLMEKKADKTKTNRKNHGFLHLVGQQLMPTVETGDVEVLVEWLDWGLSPDTKGNLHWSILHHACARGHLNIVSLLIERGANVNTEDSNKTTPLHTACYYGHLRIVKLLLDSCANVNAQDQRGNTPLYSSIEGSHPLIINLLLEHGADTTLANKEGHLFTHLVNEFLVRAVHSSVPGDVISLLRAHADPNSRDSYGFPVLSHAAFKGEVLVADGLLEAGGDPNITDASGKTPLHHAAYWGHLFIVKALVDKGANVNVTDKHGVTPLHEAAREGAEDVITVLTGRGARLDATDSDGNTPLHFAGRWGQPAAVDQLIEKGATDTHRNKSGLLYSDLALIRAVRTEDRVQVMAGLAWGGDPNSRDSRGWTLLHHAVYKGAYDVCELLLECGGDVSALDSHGRTPLLLAAYRGEHKITELLLSNGGNINKQDCTGQTALHWAASEGSTDTVQVLLDHGADTSIVSHAGLLYTDQLLKQLYLAVRHHDADQVGRLVRAGADQFAEVAGTELTPRQEAERQKHYPTIRQMSALAKKQPHPDQDKLIALEDVYRLFEDGYSTEDDDDDDNDGDGVIGSDDEDAYWKMSNAYEVLTVDEAFGNEEQAWLAEFEEKQPVISVKELCEEDQEAFWQSWEDTPPRSIPASEFFKEEANWWEQEDKEEEKEKEVIISAKEFFTEDECWWRDAVEDLDKPKVVTAKEFFKEQEAWWELEQEEEEEKEEEEKIKVTKDNWKNSDKPWWETEGDKKPNVISAKQFFQEDEQPWWETRSKEEPNVISAKEYFQEDEQPWWFTEDKQESTLMSAKQFFQDEERPLWDTNDEVEEPKVLSAREFIDDDEKPWWWQVEESPLEKTRESSPRSKLKKNSADGDAPLSDALSNGEDQKEKMKNEEEEEEEGGGEDESSSLSEISIDEEPEEWSRTEDYEDANDSLQSDTSTMYSASEGDRLPFTLPVAACRWNVERVGFGKNDIAKGNQGLGRGTREGNWEEILCLSETKEKVHARETLEINTEDRKWGYAEDNSGKGEKEREEDLSEATETLDYDTSEVSEAGTISWDEYPLRTCNLYGEEENESEEEEIEENKREGKTSKKIYCKREKETKVDNRINEIPEDEKTGSETQQEQEVNTNEEDKGIGEESNCESEEVQSEDEIADISDEEPEMKGEIKEEVTAAEEQAAANEFLVSLVNNSSNSGDEHKTSDYHQTSVSIPYNSTEQKGKEFAAEKGRNGENRRRRRRRVEEEDTGMDGLPNRVSRLQQRRTNLAVAGTSMLLEFPQKYYPEGHLQKSDSQTSGYESSVSESRPLDSHVDCRESDMIQQVSRPSKGDEMHARENVVGQEADETLKLKNEEMTERVGEDNSTTEIIEMKTETPASPRTVVHMKLDTNSRALEGEADEIKREEKTNMGSVYESVKLREDMTVQPRDVVREKLNRDNARLHTSEESLSSSSSSSSSSDSKSGRSAVNRMDACLAKVDASLAWVDARLTRDSGRSRSHKSHQSLSEKRRARAVRLEEKGAETSPKYTKKVVHVPAGDDGGKTKAQDGVVLMKVHVRVSETDADGGTGYAKGKFIPGTFLQEVVTKGGNNTRKKGKGMYSFPDNTPLSTESICTTYTSTTNSCTVIFTPTHPRNTHSAAVDSSSMQQPHPMSTVNKLPFTDHSSTSHSSPTSLSDIPAPIQSLSTTTHTSPTSITDTPSSSSAQTATESACTTEYSLPEVTEEATIKLNKTGKLYRVNTIPLKNENLPREAQDEEGIGSQVVEGTIVIATQSYEKDGSSDEVEETTSDEVEETSSEEVEEISECVKEISEDVEGSAREEESSEYTDSCEKIEEGWEDINDSDRTEESSEDLYSSERIEENNGDINSSERIDESIGDLNDCERTDESSERIEEINDDLHGTSEEGEGNSSSPEDIHSEGLDDQRSTKVLEEGDAAEKLEEKSMDSLEEMSEEAIGELNESLLGNSDRETEHTEVMASEGSEETCKEETIDMGKVASTEYSKTLLKKWTIDKPKEMSTTAKIEQNSGEEEFSDDAKESEKIMIYASHSEEITKLSMDELTEDSFKGLKDISRDGLDESQQRVMEESKGIPKRRIVESSEEISSEESKEDSTKISEEKSLEEIAPESLAETKTEGCIETAKSEAGEVTAEEILKKSEVLVENTSIKKRSVDGEPVYTQSTENECRESDEFPGNTHLAPEERSCKSSSTVVSRETSAERSSSAAVSRETSAEREILGEASHESLTESDPSRDERRKLQSVKPREARWRLCSTYEPVSISEYDTLAHFLSKSLITSDTWITGKADSRSPSMESITQMPTPDNAHVTAHTPAPDHEPAHRCKHRSRVEDADNGSEMAGRNTQGRDSTAASPHQRQGSVESEEEDNGQQSPNPVPVSLTVDTNTTHPPLTPRRRREHRVEEEGSTKRPTNSTLLYDPDSKEAGLVEQATPALEKVVMQPSTGPDPKGEQQQTVMRCRTDPARKTTSCQVS